MKTRIISIIAALGAAVLCLSSCNDLLDIPQHGVQSYENYYQTDEEAQAAATSMYSLMRGIDYMYVLCKNLLTDDFWAGGGGRNDNADLEKFNEFTFGIDEDYVEGLFTTYYQIIYRANVILGHVPEETDVQKRVRAEAKVFRAWSYFELITLWGNPPLVDHELSPEEYSCPNGTTEELWALVESDLTEAVASGCLSQKKDADTYEWRVTKQFAQTVLGKAYLWQKKYSESAKVLNEVCESNLYRLWDGDYGDICTMRANQFCESMFELNRIDDKENVWNNMTMLYLMIHWRIDKMTMASSDMYTSQGWGFCVPQKNLYEDFVKVEGEDGYRLNSTMVTFDQFQEMGHAINSGQSIIAEGYLMWKWRVLAEEMPAEGYGFCSLCNFRIMRYAEALLLAAEANLMAGNQSDAEKYYNQIRTRAKLPQKTGITLDDIKIEKRLELCGESLRYQDLLRWGDAATRLASQGTQTPFLDSNGNITYQNFNDASRCGFKTGKHELLPYPGTEIRLNSAIVQNPGW